MRASTRRFLSCELLRNASGEMEDLEFAANFTPPALGATLRRKVRNHTNVPDYQVPLSRAGTWRGGGDVCRLVIEHQGWKGLRISRVILPFFS